MRRQCETFRGYFPHGFMDALFVSHIEFGRCTPQLPQNDFGVFAAAKLPRISLAEATQQQNGRARAGEFHRRGQGRFHQADNTHHRRRIDSFAQSFVIEADIASGDGSVEHAAGLRHAFDGFHQLRHDFRTFGIAEIQIIGGSHG